MRIEAAVLRMARACSLVSGVFLLLLSGAASAQPVYVSLVGSVKDALNCPAGDTACAGARLSFDAGDGVWQGTFPLKAGTWTFRAAEDDGAGTLTVYGRGAALGGPELSLSLASDGNVKFFYDPASHWITSDRNAVIVTAPGSFQSELGCPASNPAGDPPDNGDWQPGCLRSWLKDIDGDGLYTFSTVLPAGAHGVKAAINESWVENYGAGGVFNGANIDFTVPTGGALVQFEYNASTHVLTAVPDGAPRGSLALARAWWVSMNLLVWEPGTAQDRSNLRFKLHHDATGAMSLGLQGISGGKSLPLTLEPLGLPPHLAVKFPHLAGKPVLRIAETDLIQVKDILKGQIALSASDLDGRPLDATSVQLPGVLDELYTYEGQLGVSWSASGSPTVSVWAPTARSVTLHLFADVSPGQPRGPSQSWVLMRFDPATGVWSHTGEPTWKGMFYLYEVEVYARSENRVVRNFVTDPYSHGLSLNSRFSQLVDLEDAALEPSGWDTLEKPRLDAPEDITLYELHVRDFSINDLSVPLENRGTFAAFAEPGSNGMLHLRRLAKHGLTHVHLLPVFDISSVEEDRAKHQVPAGDLASMAPHSDQQQAAVMAVRDTDGFNWGYDPYHYTVPEGSYSTRPHGDTRILEFRQMVKGLSGSGLRVVMDVVYNHTSTSGQGDGSVLDRVVPGYYHRLNADGNVETSTCCQNTASEHVMFEKLMVDSLVTWAKHYKVDGFRFDLMGHHMKANLVKARDALHALTLEKDGVDGSKIYLYGEGWNFGEVGNGQRGENATQLNMAGTGIGTFSDRLRDAVRGGGPFNGLQEQGFASGLWYEPNATNQGSSEDQRWKLLHSADLIRVGLAGNLRDYVLVNGNGDTVRGSQVDYRGQPAGYTTDPQEVITYVSAHDNETLFDAIQMKAAPAASIDERVRMQNMGSSLVGLGQGIPFFHAGDELLRSKSMDRNSYNSGDWFNKLDFTYESNNWGVGLPPASGNQGNWAIMGPLLARPELKPGPAQITRGLDHFEEVLAIRKSAALFRLRTAEDIQAKVRFFNTGPSQIPGLIVMNLRDELAADGITDIVVLFNANDEQQRFHMPDYVDRAMELHPVQVSSTDPVVRGALFASPTGDFTVPGRTTAVFVNGPTPPTDGGTPDGGSADGGTEPDGGGLDGGMEPDAGTPSDGGTVDAGTDVDGGTPVDAGSPSDGGSAEPDEDGGMTDAGTGTDGGTVDPPPDAGTDPDAGSDPGNGDAGTDPDAGTNPGDGDGGTVPGTGNGNDAGVTPDAGTGNGGGNGGVGCGGCAGTGGEAFSTLSLLLGGLLWSRRRRALL